MSAPPDPAAPNESSAERRGWAVVVALVVGYIGVYLCRKNLSVAVPLLKDAFSVDRQAVGRVASVSTLAYAVGKMTLSPLVDRVGGRTGFLVALAAVALLGAAGAFAPSLALLTVLYSANRFAGAAGSPAMMKLVPTWFRPSRTGTVTAVISLSYVLGGLAATLFARQRSRWVAAGAWSWACRPSPWPDSSWRAGCWCAAAHARRPARRARARRGPTS